MTLSGSIAVFVDARVRTTRFDGPVSAVGATIPALDLQRGTGYRAPRRRGVTELYAMAGSRSSLSLNGASKHEVEIPLPEESRLGRC